MKPLSDELSVILPEVRRELARLLGDKLTGVYLFGSCARGEQRPDSDVDVLLVLSDEFEYGEMIERTSQVISDLSLKHDKVISRAFMTAEEFERGLSPFLSNIREEAVPI